MMSTISIHRPEFLTFCHDGFRVRQDNPRRYKFQRVAASWTKGMNSGSFETKKKEELSLRVSTPSVPQIETQRLPDLRFDRLQIPEKELVHENKFEFGQFMAREAMIDEEYWTAAWLRAENHWEDRPFVRHADSFKRKFAEQEFHAMKRRRESPHGQKCRCIVTVRKEDKTIKRTVLKSVVGTLDLSIGCLLYGEKFPGERVKAPLFCSIDGLGPNRYGYVSNLCVSKSARRLGIASNMLHFAIESVRSNAVEDVYIHVNRNNRPAQDLYHKMGFEIVEMASPQLLEEQTYLLRRRM